MHIAFVCNEYPPSVSGGIGTAVAAMARGLARAGDEVSVVGVYPDARREVVDGVRVWRLPSPVPVPRITWARERLAIRGALSELHRASPIDIVEWPDFQGLYLHRLPGIVDVVRVHGTAMSHWIHGVGPRRRSLEILELRTLRSIRNWIGVSDTFTQEWLQISKAKPKRLVTIYNPVDTKIFKPGRAAREEGLVLFVGGLRRRKGADVLAQAASLVARRVPQARFVYLGMESDLKKADILANAGEAAARISFEPFANQETVADWLCRASVYAMPSRYESCGNGWIEALACATPVVGSMLSCGPEIIGHQRTGLLANPENVSDVAEKIEALLKNPELGTRLAEAGLKEVGTRFTSEIAVAKGRAFYSECLGDSARAAS